MDMHSHTCPGHCGTQVGTKIQSKVAVASQVISSKHWSRRKSPDTCTVESILVHATVHTIIVPGYTCRIPLHYNVALGRSVLDLVVVIVDQLHSDNHAY